MVEFSFYRKVVAEVLEGTGRKKKLIHIITGPRQVGKTTAALQIAEKWNGQVVNASADLPLPPGPEWIHAHWDRAERMAKKIGKGSSSEVLLILDEIQKVKGWSEVVKGLWDKSHRSSSLQVLLLGSSSLLLQKGMSESLAGRFFLYRCPHWRYSEMKEAFNWDLDKWIFYGGYPGAAELIENEDNWARYITDSLVETVIARDVLQLQTITKPVLLRHLFLLACGCPAQIFSYNKMLGQLQDVGNTTTIAHYLRLLETAFLVSGLELYKRGKLKKRGSSPKLVIWNNALVNAVTGGSYETVRDDYVWWGRLVENAVGAHLMNHLSGMPYTVYYWRDRHLEVDFVIETPRQAYAIEVKSGKSGNLKGLEKFCKLYPDAIPIIIGSGGIELDEFFSKDPKEFL